MRLHLYFARRFLMTMLALTAVFFAILLLLDMIEHIRRFDTGEVAFASIVGLTLLKVPESLYEILPLIVILSTLSLFLSLARSSELVVARAAGRSALVAAMAPVAMAFLIGVASVAVLNPIVAGTTAEYEALSNRLRGVDQSTSSLTREGLWLRQGSRAGQTVIRAARANLDGTELTGVTFLGFADDGRPRYRIEAERARLVPGAWQIEAAKEWRFDAAVENPEAVSFEAARMSLASNLTADQILDSFGDPSAVPIWELPGFIRRLEAAGFSARLHKSWLHQELALPILLAAMVLVGAGFTMRHTRFGGAGPRVMAALILGFTLFFIRNFAAILGENGQIPILLATWGPPVAAVLLPLGLLLHLEDG